MAGEIDPRRNLKIRSYRFASESIDFLRKMPRDYIFETMGKQLMRCSTSIGANIIEAQAGRTKRDFTNFYQIALKSCNESKFWLTLIRDKVADKEKREEAIRLTQEAIEIGNMLGASLLTLKGKRKL